MCQGSKICTEWLVNYESKTKQAKLGYRSSEFENWLNYTYAKKLL